MNTKIFLSEEDIPRRWYNVMADLPSPLEPPLHPATGKPVVPDDLKAIFPMELIKQEMSPDRFIDIPGEVLDVLRLWRPSPLYRAYRLEKALKTPARIYYKWEGVSPPGSHKPNTAVPQVYYNMKAGIERIATETGAGQWGSALAFATTLFGLQATIYMVRASYTQKPYRKSMMQVWGAECIPSPSTRTNSGRAILEKAPDTPGSLGIAISEAVEDAATHDNTNYSLGSVLNHVCLHQTVIGLEAREQMATVEHYPDTVVGCVGGGSNFAGISFPFAGDKLTGKHPDIDIVAVEPASCPTLTKGIFTYDYGDVAGLTPLLKMYTLGHDFVPPAIHAGGLRYHGGSPILSRLVHDGVIRAVSYHQNEVFTAAQTFARSEGIIVAPETSHAVKAVIDEALKCRQSGEAKTILFNCSGHGNFDMSAYDAFYAKALVDYEYPEQLIRESLARLPKVG
ncbi:MAG TPA: TrpB-like pyridoxal phosphate-dependent enzyme [Methanoregulaceae archaeon]|nr:MAG: TrpB-like pyridoxal phosphate-dependent enzyme [Methanolinea sp.]HON80735.1 TrpB-like pyridoxal phosphate-dependent enzyme [Methanoregulaceae archaeon]HPD09470.1 TrpB-like pyridoxal phosphate-dependent enzyme [Methanoregulaceae archaeon]HRT14738.1 TrpB-like pyridoxal phosphate-dependent enzyme [Methanoregulaceae archaeon]HRU30311.1 TrpB-like pyridoxal phosphate-dependent enzyme [Methanoregulaceae archaeon]